MQKLGITPTIFLIGLNRSGTTAITQAFLNNTSTEVYRDPGKYMYRVSGKIDFSHFFRPPVNDKVKARFIKQSIGQYNAELCTIPLFPVGPNRPEFIRSLHTIFLLREPYEVWNSWSAMTRWLNSTTDRSVVEKWEQIQRDYGIPKGWGEPHLLSLCYQYLYATYNFVKYVAPGAFTILSYEHWVADPYKVTKWICERTEVHFVEAMVNWDIQFGHNCDRLVIDGFSGYGDIDSIERSFIHRSIRNSHGITKMASPDLHTGTDVNIGLTEADRIYRLMLGEFSLQYSG